MAMLEFFGCLFLAFGPPLAMFIITVAKDPIRIIVLITSAFFWLVSLFFSALIWFAIVPLRDHLAFALFFSVLIQEAFRYLFYLFIRKAEKGLTRVEQNVLHKDAMQLDSRIISYVSGFGFGVISGAFSLVNVLSDMTGPGTVGIFGDSQMFFLVSSLITLCFILLHTCWSITMYLSLSTFPPRSVQLWISIALVVLSHMFVSGLSLINDSKTPTTYIYSVLFSYLTLFVNTAYSIFVLKRTYKTKLSM